MHRLIFMLIDWCSILVFAIPAVWALDHFLWKKSRAHTVWSLILVVYLAEMYNIVGIPAAAYWTWEPTLNFIPFGNGSSPFQLGANVIMLVPLGFLLPVLWQSKRSIVKTTLSGALVSALIEAIQLFCYRTTDIDDLLMNTLGAALGGCLFLVYSRIFRKKAANPAASTRDNIEFWVTNLVVILTIIFLRSFVSDEIYNLFFA